MTQTKLHHGQRVLAQGIPATIVIADLSKKWGYPLPHAELDYDNGDRGCHVPHSMIEPLPEKKAERLPEREVFDILLSEALPLLAANLDAAHREYIDGKIPAGAFRHVRDRHSIIAALCVMTDLPLERALAGAQSVAIDLKTAAKDANRPEFLERWISMYREAGYVADHPLFGTPMVPVAEAA